MQRAQTFFLKLACVQTSRKKIVEKRLHRRLSKAGDILDRSDFRKSPLNVPATGSLVSVITVYLAINYLATFLSTSILTSLDPQTICSSFSAVNSDRRGTGIIQPIPSRIVAT